MQPTSPRRPAPIVTQRLPKRLSLPLAYDRVVLEIATYSDSVPARIAAVAVATVLPEDIHEYVDTGPSPEKSTT